MMNAQESQALFFIFNVYKQGSVFKIRLNVYFHCVKIDETRIFINWIFFKNIEQKKCMRSWNRLEEFDG